MFLHLHRFFRQYYSPDDITGNGLPPANNSKEDIIDFLKDDDDDDKGQETINLDDKRSSKEVKGIKEDKEDDKEDKTPDESDAKDKLDEDENEEIDELKELEEELKEDEEEVDEEKLELITPVRRKDILKKYPKLFEEFPYLEKAYYREQQFTEYFPHPSDAKEALEKARTLDLYEKDLLAGNTEKQLAAVKAEAPEAFNKLVDEYLPTLAKVDKDAYIHVIGNIIKETIVSMVMESRKSKNESLESAAQLVNQFVFGSSDFEPSKPLSVEKPKDSKESDEVKRLQEERTKFRREQFNSVSSELHTRLENTFKNTIEQHIDPKDSMTPYAKKNAIRDANENLQKLISQDSRFKTIINKLWEKAAENNFNKESVDKIRSAFLAKGKTLLPSVIKMARHEALRGSGKRVVDKVDKEDNDDNDNEPVKKSKNNEPPRSNRNRNSGPKVPEGMSTLEFLNSD